jgi:hypothetical protein
VQFSQKQSHPFVIPKPALPARNLLAATSEAADSSRDNAALLNDNSLGVFKLHHYAAFDTTSLTIRLSGTIVQDS